MVGLRLTAYGPDELRNCLEEHCQLLQYNVVNEFVEEINYAALCFICTLGSVRYIKYSIIVKMSKTMESIPHKGKEMKRTTRNLGRQIGYPFPTSSRTNSFCLDLCTDFLCHKCSRPLHSLRRAVNKILYYSIRYKFILFL